MNSARVQGHTRVIAESDEITHRFDQKWAFRGSEWARWLGLVAFLLGNHIKCRGTVSSSPRNHTFSTWLTGEEAAVDEEVVKKARRLLLVVAVVAAVVAERDTGRRHRLVAHLPTHRTQTAERDRIRGSTLTLLRKSVGLPVEREVQRSSNSRFELLTGYLASAFSSRVQKATLPWLLPRTSFPRERQRRSDWLIVWG